MREQINKRMKKLLIEPMLEIEKLQRMTRIRESQSLLGKFLVAGNTFLVHIFVPPVSSVWACVWLGG
jgi:hypothetical protein